MTRAKKIPRVKRPSSTPRVGPIIHRSVFPVIHFHVGVRPTAAMVLEATFIVIDNSDWMRNSDFAPSRLDAQQDAVNLLAAAKYAGRGRKSSARLGCPSAAQTRRCA